MVKGNKLLTMSLVATLVAGSAFSGVASADQYSEKVFDESRASGGAMILDAGIARPVLIASTVLGAAFFVVTAPFTLAGGTTSNSWNTFVVTPAEQAFVRCLGCTPVQHDRVRTERKTALRAEEAAAASGEPAAPAAN